MIRIHKPALGPAILHRPDASGTTPAMRVSSQVASGLEPEFESGIYGHPLVKRMLRNAQHCKCAFCESKFFHVAYGDVEHFRPKGGYVQDLTAGLQKPGYYWLAYEWSNLYASCAICNQRFKKNHFPLDDGTKRAIGPGDSTATETPFLIDPGSEDPALHIGFRKEVPYPINGSARGNRTIELLGLDRTDLNDVRFSKYKHLELHCESYQTIASLDPNNAILPRLKAAIDAARRPESEYSAMAASIATHFGL